MDFNAKFQALTLILSLITLSINVFLTIKENGKKDMIEYLTQERLNDLHKMRVLSNKIISLTNLIVTNTNNIDERKYINSIYTAYNNLLFYLKPVYEIDRNTINSLRLLIVAIAEYYKNSSENTREIINYRNVSFNLHISLYMYSSWVCIKDQILKGRKCRYKEFEIYYKKYKIDFIRSFENHI
jgi:hypothetical protein